MILTDESVNFLASKKKIEFLRKVENQNTEDTGVPPIKLFVRDRVCTFRNLYNNFIVNYINSMLKNTWTSFYRVMKTRQILQNLLT